LRRNAAGTGATHVRFGDISVDLDRQRVTRGGAEVHLSPTEFALLRTFVGKPGAVWTHRQLIGAVWGGGAGVSNDTVRVHVGSLRRKLERDPNRPRVFITEPWVGYRFTGDAPAE
jgi:two-component system KDP operon response regulator KdpE